MKRWYRTALCVALSFMCLFICVGYAAVTGELSIQGTVDVQAPKAVYITSIEFTSLGAGTTAETNHFSGTLADLSVHLGASESSTVTVNVTVYNNTMDYYAFRAVNYVLGNETYETQTSYLTTPMTTVMCSLPIKKDTQHSTRVNLLRLRLPLNMMISKAKPRISTPFWIFISVFRAKRMMEPTMRESPGFSWAEVDTA